QLATNNFLVRLVDADLGTVFKNLEADPIGLSGCCVEDCNIGDIDGSFFFYNSTWSAKQRIRLGVALDHVDSGNGHPSVVVNLQDLATLAFVFACYDDHFIIAFDLFHNWPQSSQYLRRQRDDLHKLLATQFTGDWSKNTGADRGILVVQQYRRVAIETDQGSVATANAFGCTHHNRFHYLALFHFPAGDRFFDGHFDDIDDICIAAM